MADNIAHETNPDILPNVMKELDNDQRESLKSFITLILKEWGSLHEKELEAISETYGITREDSINVVRYVEEVEDILPAVDLDTREIKIAKHSYEIGRLLGTGKYAEVRRGRNTRSGKLFALKILYVDGTRREIRMLRDQIKDELRAFKKIKHKNIVKLYAFDCKSAITHQNNNARPCMIQVQELCEKGELYDFVQYNGHLPEKLCRTLFLDFCKGLHACHAKGIAHRDLKPDNILVDRDYNVKLCDFGFAKSFVKKKGDTGGARRVNMRTILGTPGYMSPEMLLKMPYNEKTDVFSAGVILFILLAGYPPLQTAEIGDWWFERLLEGRHRKFWQAHERGAVRFSDAAKELIIGMLEPNPSERFSILDVINSAFFQGEVFSEEEYKEEMQKLQEQMDQQRAEQRSELTRDTEVQAVTQFVMDQGDWKPSLERMCENKFVRRLREITTEAELLQCLETLSSRIGGSDLGQALIIDDPVQAAKALADARDMTALKAVLNVDDNTGENLILLLSPFKETAVDGHIMGMGGEIIDSIFQLPRLSLPTHDPNLETLPLHTYRLKCGLDILGFALRYVCKAKEDCKNGAKRHGRMNVLPDEGTFELQFEIKKRQDLVITDDHNEDADAERARQKALAERLEALGLSGQQLNAMVPDEVTYFLNMHVTCMKDPQDSDVMIVAFSRQDSNYADTTDFTDAVECILHETCLQAFLLDDAEENVQGQQN